MIPKNKNAFKIYLQGIFDYYSIKYKLNADLDIITYGRSGYSFKSSVITLAIDYYKFNKGTFIQRANLLKNSVYEVVVASLLHELKHVIDKKSGLLDYEIDNIIDCHKYQHELGYHDSCPFEKRADYFAVSELSKWV